jgi:hypothetical protein
LTKQEKSSEQIVKLSQNLAKLDSLQEDTEQNELEKEKFFDSQTKAVKSENVKQKGSIQYPKTQQTEAKKS